MQSKQMLSVKVSQPAVLLVWAWQQPCVCFKHCQKKQCIFVVVNLPVALRRGTNAQLTGSTEACHWTCKGLTQQRQPAPAHKTRWLAGFSDPGR